MKKFVIAAIIFGCFVICLCCFVGCQARDNRARQWHEPNGKVKIIATIAPIAELVIEIVKEEGDVLTLIGGELDPHSYQLVKGDREKLDFADLIFACGVGLEHNAALRTALSSSAKTQFLGDKIWEAFPERTIQYNQQRDPHLWQDVALWAEAIPFIVKSLSTLYPQNADFFTENGTALREKLLGLHRELFSLLQAVPEERRYLVTSHDAFNYFTRAYLSHPQESQGEGWRRRSISPEGLAPDSQLSFKDLEEVIDFIYNHGVEVIFCESNVSRDSLMKIHEVLAEKRRKVRFSEQPLFGDSIGAFQKGGGTYERMMRHNGYLLYRELSGKRDG